MGVCQYARARQSVLGSTSPVCAPRFLHHTALSCLPLASGVSELEAPGCFELILFLWEDDGDTEIELVETKQIGGLGLSKMCTC